MMRGNQTVLTHGYFGDLISDAMLLRVTNTPVESCIVEDARLSRHCLVSPLMSAFHGLFYRFNTAENKKNK